MKRLPIMFLATAFAAASAFAGYGDEPLTEDEWWKKEGFFLVDAFYTQIEPKCGPGDFGSPMVGGGFGAGGEYVNSDLHFGYGCHLSLTILAKDYTGYSVEDNIIGFDAYIPVRIANTLTLYAGAGINNHNMSISTDEVGEIQRANVSFSRTLTDDVFFGLRWRFFRNAHLFCEYRRDFGKVKFGYRTVQLENRYIDIDMSGNRVVAGLGMTF